MSYDISLMVNKPVDVLDLNYTYNVSPMFKKAFGENGIHSLNGLTGFSAAAFLRGAIQNMEECPGTYRLLNPVNGWGNYEGALNVLKTMLIKCEQYPDGIIEIS